MGKDWDYAKLAQEACNHGGPEKYIEAIRDDGFRKGELVGKGEGRVEVLVAEGIALGLGILIYGGYKAYTKIKDKHLKDIIDENADSVEDAEEQLKKEIYNAYDSYQ